MASKPSRPPSNTDLRAEYVKKRDADPDRSVYKPSQLPDELASELPADSQSHTGFLPSRSIYQPNLRGRNMGGADSIFHKPWVRVVLVFVVLVPVLAIGWVAFSFFAG